MTTQAPGTGERRALLIGTGRYDALPALLSPEVDCDGLTEVLSDPEIGGFEVQPLVNADRSTLERAMEEFFLTAQRDDLCLLYLSCHGIESRNEKLYFAVGSTDPDRPAHSAISARFVHDLMDECRARSIIVVLDCCYSGLFIPGAKGTGSAGFEEVLSGHGRVVITAGTRTQRVWEGDHAEAGAAAPSRFTSALVEGLRSGAADLNGDGLITIQELYQYASKRLHEEGIEQDPLWAGEMQYEIVLAKVKKKRRKRPSRTTSAADSARRAEPWRIPAASGPARQPVLSDGTLIVHEKRRLHVFDAESRRRYPLIETKYAGRPAFHRGAAYFPNREHLLQGVDLRTRTARRVPRLQVCDGLLGVSADVLYVPSPDDALHAVDLLSGDLRWSHPLGPLRVRSVPQVTADNVVFIAQEAGYRVTAVRGATGSPSWSYEPEAPLSPEWAVTDLGVHVVQELGPSQQRITTLDPASGEPLWEFDTAAVLAAAPAAVDGFVVFGDVDNRLVVLDAKTGSPLWEREKKTRGRLRTRPFIAGDTLFTADRSAELMAWKLPTGRKLRTHDILLSPDRQGCPAVDGDALYLTDSHGDLHSLPARGR